MEYIGLLEIMVIGITLGAGMTLGGLGVFSIVIIIENHFK
jgi:hypothetical protein